MTTDQIYDVFNKHHLTFGRMISAYKEVPQGEVAYFNANAIIPSLGKIWYGDINITKSGDVLKQIAKELGETIYILREHDCRFDTENLPVEQLIQKAVWNTDII